MLSAEIGLEIIDWFDQLTGWRADGDEDQTDVFDEWLKFSSGCTSVKCLEDMIREVSYRESDDWQYSFPFDIKVRVLSRSAWPEFKEYNKVPLNLKIEEA